MWARAGGPKGHGGGTSFPKTSPDGWVGPTWPSLLYKAGEEECDPKATPYS